MTNNELNQLTQRKKMLRNLIAQNFESNGMEEKLIKDVENEISILEKKRVEYINSNAFLTQWD